MENITNDSCHEAVKEANDFLNDVIANTTIRPITDQKREEVINRFDWFVALSKVSVKDYDKTRAALITLCNSYI